MSRVVSGAWEAVEHGMMTEEDFGAFTFGNIVKMSTEQNADFFVGTAIESTKSARGS